MIIQPLPNNLTFLTQNKKKRKTKIKNTSHKTRHYKNIHHKNFPYIANICTI
nr:MAG TPA: hypothetical protein [Caudoviricetes sp.]